MRFKKREKRPPTYWRPWFAILPVRLENNDETVWLEWVWVHVDRYNQGEHVEVRYRDDVTWSSANLELRRETA
jgi:hypothetical protein